MGEYLLSVHHEDGEPALSPEDMQRAFAQVDEFNRELQDAGKWVFAGGLQPPTTAVVVQVRDGHVATTDGPVNTGGQSLGGFWVITAADRDEALAWTAKAAAACMSPVELRPFQAE